MNKHIVDLWNLSKDGIRKYLTENPQKDYAQSYEQLFTVILKEFNKNIEHHFREFDIDQIKVIDYGDYQGSFILIVPEKCYQPSPTETWFTTVEYGSCSGCDALLSISDYSDGIATAEQIIDYMALCLHLIEHMHDFAYTGEIPNDI